MGMLRVRRILSDGRFLAKSLSDENRLRILLCVSNGKKSVSSIVEELGLSQPWYPPPERAQRSLLVKNRAKWPVCFTNWLIEILDVLQTLSVVATDLLHARKNF